MKLVTINTYQLPHELAIDRSKLEAAGIQCFVRDEFTVQVHNFYSNAIGGVKLEVMEGDLITALDILGLNSSKRSAPSCPNCGSMNVGPKSGILHLKIIVFNLIGKQLKGKDATYKCGDCQEEFTNLIVV